MNSVLMNVYLLKLVIYMQTEHLNQNSTHEPSPKQKQKRKRKSRESRLADFINSAQKVFSEY